MLEQDDAPAAEGHGSEHRGRLAPESTAVRAAVSVSCECVYVCVSRQRAGISGLASTTHTAPMCPVRPPWLSPRRPTDFLVISSVVPICVCV